MTLTPVHLVRAGEGLDAVRVQTRGVGLVFGSFGVLKVRGTFDQVLHARLDRRAFALYVGTRGIRWASIALPGRGRADVPDVRAVRTPEPPGVVAPELAVQLAVRPPEPP